MSAYDRPAKSLGHKCPQRLGVTCALYIKYALTRSCTIQGLTVETLAAGRPTKNLLIPRRDGQEGQEVLCDQGGEGHPLQLAPLPDASVAPTKYASGDHVQ